jgi:hypothetical protein
VGKSAITNCQGKEVPEWFRKWLNTSAYGAPSKPNERVRMSTFKRIGGIKQDGSAWKLTQDKAISEIEEGTSMFYVERPEGHRFDVIIAMDFRANKYLKTVADREQPEKLLSLPNCP